MGSISQPCVVPLQVIVVGAGLGGLSVAIALARLGNQVLVLESAEEILSLGAGVVLPPTTRSWFESEGVLQTEDPICVPVDGFEICRWDTGELVVRTAANPVGKQTAIHRGDLQLALLHKSQQFENIEIRFGSRVVGVDVEEHKVLVAGGESVVGDLIIGADGVKSTIKKRICPPEACEAKPTGAAAYRFTLPRHALESDPELVELINRPWVKRWDGPGSHVVAYPIHDYQILNVVLVHTDDGETDESWTTVTEKYHVVEDFRAWNSTLHKLIDLAPAEVPNFRMFLYPPSPVWVKGSTILLGDSCHAMLPYLGQGVAQAVEDATAIAAVISLIEEKDQLPIALKAYEKSRKGRVDQIQAASAEAQEKLHLKDEKAQAIRDLERVAASKTNQNSDVVKMQQAFWVWDAGEVARNVFVDLLKESGGR